MVGTSNLGSWSCHWLVHQPAVEDPTFTSQFPPGCWSQTLPKKWPWSWGQHCVFTPWSEYFFHGFWYLEGLVYNILYMYNILYINYITSIICIYESRSVCLWIVDLFINSYPIGDALKRGFLYCWNTMVLAPICSMAFLQAFSKPRSGKLLILSSSTYIIYPLVN